MSLKFQVFGYTFTPRLLPTLLTIILIPILISLGLWQLDRAEEKRVTDEQVNVAIAKPALLLNNTDLTNLNNKTYRSVLIDGHYDTKQQFLLDNRTHKGRPGYHVLSPFVFKQGSTQYGVLINRGWIHYENTRDNIPNINVTEDLKTIRGSIKQVPESIVLKNNVEDKDFQRMFFKTKEKQLRDVSLIQSIQLDKLREALNYALLPVIIELDKTAENGFVREWHPYYGSVDKHNAYAVQWFAMASIVLFLFIKLNTKKVDT